MLRLYKSMAYLRCFRAAPPWRWQAGDPLPLMPTASCLQRPRRAQGWGGVVLPKFVMIVHDPLRVLCRCSLQTVELYGISKRGVIFRVA